MSIPVTPPLSFCKTCGGLISTADLSAPAPPGAIIDPAYAGATHELVINEQFGAIAYELCVCEKYRKAYYDRAVGGDA